MNELEQAIRAIEHGLLEVARNGEPSTKKMELSQRMKHYKVPGFNAAFIYQEELAWAKGFGVVEAGSEKLVTTETIFQAASISEPVTGRWHTYPEQAAASLWSTQLTWRA